MKKVIIDDVDVSWCERFISPTRECLKCETVYDEKCEGKDCDYKRLQKLKQQYADVLKLAKENADSNEYCLQELEKENEQLKKSIDRLMQNKEIKTIDLDIAKENAELKAENERLKEEILKWQKAYSRQYQINENKGYNKKEEQYRQTLQEIRDIVSEPCIVDENCQTCNSGCMQKDILTKINEVIGVE